MFELLTISALLCCGLVRVDCGDIGPGVWNLLHINKCEEADHKFKFDVDREKLNRTHDGFNSVFQLEEDFTDEFGVRLDICKDVDGGCKPYQVLSDNSFIGFVNKYAKSNVERCLELANIDPPEFPIPAGNYEINDFIFDYSELPEDGPYGEFAARVYMLKGAREIGCIEVWVEFIEEAQED